MDKPDGMHHSNRAMQPRSVPAEIQAVPPVAR